MKATTKSVLKSIDALIQEAKRDNCNLGAYSPVSGCQYEDEDGRRCAIGFFFTKDQIDWIKSHDLNIDTSVDDLAKWIGEDNLIATTGFNKCIAFTVQSAHDESVLETSSYRFNKNAFIEKLISLQDSIQGDPEFWELV